MTSIACTLMASVYALGGVSGANFNPAVFLVRGIANTLERKDVGDYMGCHIAGGIRAGLVYGLALWDVFNLAPIPGIVAAGSRGVPLHVHVVIRCIAWCMLKDARRQEPVLTNKAYCDKVLAETNTKKDGKTA